MKQIGLAFMLLVSCWLSIVHASGPGTTNANFLKAGQGVRPIAMGETYISLGHGIDTLYWNPAGLAQLQSPEATFTHSFWVQEIGTEYLAFGMPMGPIGAFGGGITYMNAGTITQTLEDEYGNYIGTGGDVSAMSLAVIGTYAQKLGRLIPIKDPIIQNTLIGASLRIVSESIDQASILGGAIDIGAIWRQTEAISIKEKHSIDAMRGIGDKIINYRDGGWRAGFVAQNLGMTSDQMMPINFRAGVGYLINDALTTNGQATLALDALLPVDNNIKLSVGGEYAYITETSRMALRFGYRIGNEIQDLDSLAGLTAGAGFSMLLGPARYQIDYAFVPYGDLGTTHRASLTIGFASAKNIVKSISQPKASLIDNPNILKQAVDQLKAEDAKADKANNANKKTAASQAAKQAPHDAKTTQAQVQEVDRAKQVNEQAEPSVGQSNVPGSQSGLADSQAKAELEAQLETEKPDTSKKLKSAIKRIMGSIKAGMLPAVQFERGTDTITRQSKRSLQQLAKQLERYDGNNVVIIGFAGSNKELAAKRADSVLRHLKMNYRIDTSLISTRSGEKAQQPKNTEVDFEVKGSK